MSRAVAPSPTDAAADPGGEQRLAVQPGLTRLLWHDLKPQWRRLLLAMFLSLIAGVATTYQNVFPKYLIDDVILAEAERTPWGRLVLVCSGYVLAGCIARSLMWHLGLRLFTAVREQYIFDLRSRFFRHVNHLGLRFHEHRGSGELFSYLFGSPVNTLQSFLRETTMSAPAHVFMLLSTLAVMVWWDWLMSLVLLGLLVVTAGVMVRARRKIRKIHKDYQEVEADVSGRVADLLRGNRAVKIHSMERKAGEEFDQQAHAVRDLAYTREIITHKQHMMQEWTAFFGFALLGLLGAWRYWNGQIEVGELTAFFTSFLTIQAPMQHMFRLATQHGSAEISLQRIHAVLETPSTTPDPAGEVLPPPGRGPIELRDVSFAYVPGEPVLRDVNLTVPYGQRVALVGPSGGGKSTLTQLLLRLYDPTDGQVVIDGTDLRHCRGAELRRRFAVVPQDPFIFRTTVRENLLIARPDASEEQLIDACRRAHAWEFIADMPHQLDQPVGEGGVTLSGGQRQRLAIARSLLFDADYYVFDEATSALDSISERRVQEAAYDAVAGRTAIIIAHRLATVKHCDRVLVIDGGGIAQDGPYAELAEQDGIFRQMLQDQTLLA